MPRNVRILHRDPHNQWVLALVPIHVLKPHEEVDENHLRELAKQIISDGVLKHPILADMDTMTILDGHHRVEILKRLGKKLIPAILIDYDSDCVKVTSFRPGYEVSKESIRRMATEGKRFPPRTSRHKLCFEIPETHILLSEL